MRAAEYNVQEIHAGNITSAHMLGYIDINEFTAEVRAWQAAVGLRPDGKLGPLSRGKYAEAPGSLELREAVYQPIVGGCFWSANAFRPGHHDGRDGFRGPKGPKGWPKSGGAMVCAITDGEIMKTHSQDNGFWVKIDHGSGLVTLSGHLYDDVGVRAGDDVVGGDYLGTLYKDVHPPHIHAQAWVNGKLVDIAVLLEELGAGIWME